MSVTNWLVNGEREGRLSPADRGLAYGDGLFETIALRAGRWRFLDYHLERLHTSCARLAIPPPVPAVVESELEQLRGNAQHGTAKLIITRGVGARGYRPPAAASTTRAIGVTADNDAGSSWAAGIRVRLCRTTLSENAALAGMKTLNRLEQVLAGAEWDAPEIAEGLMMTRDGHIVCGTMSNLFLVRHGKLLTPSLEQCGVQGIMRRVILEEAERLGIAVQEVVITARALEDAEELFVSNSLRGIGPVTAWAEQTREPGALTRALMGALAGRGVDECAAA